MKKNFKRAMAAVMAAALTLSLAGNAAEADAAKKPKLAKKSVSVTVKQTKTVKIKNVKAKNVKKLSVKSANKKIVTVKKKGKTAVKVTGKKASKSAVKVTVSVTLKGKKKATKLTLKVKVTAKAPAKTPAPDVPAPSANVPAPSADAPAPSAPGTETAAPTAKATKEPTAAPTPWVPDPSIEEGLKDITLTYDHQFTGPAKVLFKDGAGYPAADSLEGGVKGGIDVRYYDTVIATYTADRELTVGDDGWAGKATLNNQDESEYGNGFYLRYLNDLEFKKESEDKANGSYVIEYNIQKLLSDTCPGGLRDEWDFDDVSQVDCVSVQLETKENPYVDEVDEEGNAVPDGKKGVNFRLKKIEFKTKDSGDTPGPNTPGPDTNTPGPDTKTPGPDTNTTAPTTAPTEEPTPAPVTLKVGDSNEIYEEDTAEIVISGYPEGATLKSANLTAVNVDKDGNKIDNTDKVAVVNNTVTAGKVTVEAKKAGYAEISGTVTMTVGGKDVTINATPLTLTVTAKGTPMATVTVDTQPVEMIVTETADITSAVTVRVGTDVVTADNVTYTWSANNTNVKVIDKGNGKAQIVGLVAGDAVVTVKVTATKDGKTSAEKTATVAVKVYDKLTVDTESIEFAKDEIAINESVAFKNFTTNGTVDVESIEWAIVDTASKEIATVDAKGNVTGKKTGTAKIQATVRVTKGGNQDETVVITGTITVNKNRRIVLTNANASDFPGGQLFDAAGNKTGKCVENEDGSLTFYTNAIYSGSGVEFKLNEDGSNLDLDSYSAIEVKGTSSGDAGGMVFSRMLDGKKPPAWNPSGAPQPVGLAEYRGFGEINYRVELKASDIPQDTDLEAECGMCGIQVKYNGNECPTKGASQEEQEACKATVTIYSIELIAK